MMHRFQTALILLLVSFLAGCATLPGATSPNVSVVGLERLPSEGMEARFSLKLRIQNPNESSMKYDGMSVKLALDGRGLASGVSNESGEIPRFSDTVLTVPVSISAFGVVRQLLAFAEDAKTAENPLNQTFSYSLTGKLGAAEGSIRAISFSDKGELNLFGTE